MASPPGVDTDGPGFKHVSLTYFGFACERWRLVQLTTNGTRQATIREIYRLVQDPSTRVSAPALHLSSEYLKLFTTEAIHRAAEIAQREKDQAVGPSKKGNAKDLDLNPGLLETKHLEQVLAGMLLDF
ncbi:CENP-X/MHF2 family protein [Sporobolomyces koalae]|uniref:CENP-X/MHF2 family protein n=1 Tax=Sporobolomyces koalae TaxID=500713 RepID=UPI003178DCB4